MSNQETNNLLRHYAQRYETEAFLADDPSQFIHRVKGRENQEIFGFIASSLSYGRREQFIPKIESLLQECGSEPFEWVKSGGFRSAVPNDKRCFYRLNTYGDMFLLLSTLRDMVTHYGSVGGFLQSGCQVTTGEEALKAFTAYFQEHSANGFVPKNTTSCCKRLCMFLRWMVRNNSPVDLGLWSYFIDKRTLIMPMDTHVVQQSVALGLLNSRNASMSSARKLTERMLLVFPDDPLKGDFALFGLGITKDKAV